MDAWEVAGSIATVAATIVAAVAAYQSRAAAREANRTATTVAAIEAQRRQDELRPRFEVTVAHFGTGENGILDLRLKLVGPSGLNELDRLTVEIRNYDHLRTTDHVEGPFKLTPRAGFGGAIADECGRRFVTAQPLPRGGEVRLQLEQTNPSPTSLGVNEVSRLTWLTTVGPTIRVLLVAERQGYEPWRLLFEVDSGDLPYGPVEV